MSLALGAVTTPASQPASPNADTKAKAKVKASIRPFEQSTAEREREPATRDHPRL